jgi:hypothetical protein
LRRDEFDDLVEVSLGLRRREDKAGGNAERLDLAARGLE